MANDDKTGTKPPTASPAKPPTAAKARVMVDDPDAPRAPQVCLEPPTPAEVKERKAKGEKLFECKLPKGFTGHFWARSKLDAKEQYLTYFGVISSDHKLEVQEADEDDVPDLTKTGGKKKGDASEEAGDEGEE